MIFQGPFSSLNPRMRAAEILDEGLASLQPEVLPAERRSRVETICEQVGLRREALQRFAHEFSGGQRQRVAIARALAVSPKLIVCGEPSPVLDVSGQAQILNLLREPQRELGVSFLFIARNIAVVEVIADRVPVMQAGAIVEQGVAADVLQRPQPDQTRDLLAAVPRLWAAALSAAAACTRTPPARVPRLETADSRRLRKPVSRRHVAGNQRHRQACSAWRRSAQLS